MVITLLVGQSLLPVLSVSANSIIGITEFSETTRNPNLTNKLTVFTSPIYLKDPIANEWIPTTDGEGGSFPVYQISLSEEDPTNNLSSQQHLVAGEQDTLHNVTLLKFGKMLPDLNGGLIQNASLHMFEVDKPVKWGYFDPTYIDSSYSVHKVLTPWDGEDVTWADQPALSNPYADKTFPIGVDGGHFKWDVSKLVAEWYQAPEKDYGLAIMGNELGS
ncbi:DNRLRE domain-containing protein [Sutcliffiella rhizosphaerae]|uniref:Carbohydrate-binding module family 96 domain-containing protein n=1 Tax=Sutcliffiella rhizosphaerae TaxID=2880967 RepID=A0ABM8YK77_9BACI|nr:DNRLRE domain-containing protein [Sutcliffiella rhizosphaerae]CAG9620329.1 hypothetical protein BACCIP111883_01097 [Sutcliffiella rhizosphaerae]